MMGPRLSLPSLGERFADRIGAAVHGPRQTLVYHEPRLCRQLVGFVEPSAARDTEAQHLRQVHAGVGIVAISRFLSGQVESRHGKGASHRRSAVFGDSDDLGHAPQCEDCLLHGDGIGRGPFSRMGAWSLESDGPYILYLVTQGTPEVQVIAKRIGGHRGDQQKADQQLQAQQKLTPFPVPGQPQEMADHRLPPFSASAGWSRDILQAG